MPDENDYSDLPLGPCCRCSQQAAMNGAIIMLPKLAPIPGRGWGCVKCGLPPDGAIVVLCKDCADEHGNSLEGVKFACAGSHHIDGRVPIESLQGDFRHDMTKHPEASPNDKGD